MHPSSRTLLPQGPPFLAFTYTQPRFKGFMSAVDGSVPTKISEYSCSIKCTLLPMLRTLLLNLIALEVYHAPG